MRDKLRALRRICPPPSPMEPSICRSGSSMGSPILFPDAQRPKLFAGGAGPVFIGGVTGGAGMKNFSNLQWRICENEPGAFLRKVTDADQPFRLKNFDHAPQMFVAGGEDRGHAGGGQFVRRYVAAGFGEERQRTIVDDKMVFEKGIGAGEFLSEQTPQSSAAHFGTRTLKSFHGPLWMFAIRPANGSIYFE